MLVVLLGLTNHAIAEDDPDLSVAGLPVDGLETGFFRRLGVHPLDVVLEFAHEEQDADDGERPHDEHGEKQSLIGGHVGECRV
ncbi:MAG: hypothetical protein QOG04_1697 [Actinomycetota bacterium]|nr:hypothetical protein [Actinomycetota bacterium]